MKTHEIYQLGLYRLIGYAVKGRDIIGMQMYDLYIDDKYMGETSDVQLWFDQRSYGKVDVREVVPPTPAPKAVTIGTPSIISPKLIKCKTRTWCSPSFIDPQDIRYTVRNVRVAHTVHGAHFVPSTRGADVNKMLGCLVWNPALTNYDYYKGQSIDDLTFVAHLTGDKPISQLRNFLGRSIYLDKYN